MDDARVKIFMTLAGQQLGLPFNTPNTSTSQPSDDLKKLGARLLLSEVLEYIIDGLGVVPVVNGTRIEEPDALTFEIKNPAVSRIEMLDGLADVAYTMFWNALAFGVPLEEGFAKVAENNLDKFVLLSGALPHTVDGEICIIPEALWHLELGVQWPKDVARVELIQVGATWYAVGKDSHGKVRKPSTYKPVDLTHLVAVGE